jgi:tetratricopeptide (TPR) repeat protein
MKKNLCLIGALILSFSALSCVQLKARVEIRDANDAYEREDYQTALTHYQRARQIDPGGFPEIDRMIGYCNIGLFQPDVKDPANEKHADMAIVALQKYLRVRPVDRIARDALVSTFLSANRISQAIDYYRGYLQKNQGDLEAVKSIATLYAKQGNFAESLNWYEKITLLEPKNPESFYTYGVVLYEKVAKDPPADPVQRLAFIEKGKAALQHAIDIKPDYFEAMAYLNLLFRQQALVEKDPLKQQELIKQADTIRGKTIDIIRAKKLAAAGPKK